MVTITMLMTVELPTEIKHTKMTMNNDDHDNIDEPEDKCQQ